ncbi:MAG TPA: choice-of-anchor Q domain-containing protein [Nocardioides sp.]|nr:choice-of-anchor Q domain-containing protein [Nocardioides sp.]
MSRLLSPAMALVSTGLIGVGLVLTSLPAQAASPHRASTSPPGALGVTLTGRRTPDVRLPSATEFARVRAAQRRMLADHRPAPTFAGVAARAATPTRRFTVDTTEDSGLANPASGRCIDAATGACSLRAAVDAANNRKTPTRILLGQHRYVLTSGEQLTVTGSMGISIVGTGARHTTIQGDGSRVFEETPQSPSSPAPLLFVTDLTVTGGSGGDGAGFLLNPTTGGDATLVLNGVVVTRNTASGSGGALNLSGGSLYATHSAFTGNVSTNGGALSTTQADIDLSDVSITGNHSPLGSSGLGGAWQNQNGVIRMRGGSISGNTAGDLTSGGQGGGLYDQLGNVTFTGVHLDHNTAGGAGQDAGKGGGLWGYGDLVQITGGTISHNHARGPASSGGAVYLEADAQLGLDHLMMAGNQVSTDPADSAAGFGGGALYVHGTGGGATRVAIGSGTTIKGSNASAVYAYASGGQIDLNVDHARLTGNTDAFGNGFNGFGCGGAVCLNSDQSSAVSLSLHQAQVVGNTSAGDLGSGGISAYANIAATVRLHPVRSTFRDNTTGAGGLGGAIGVWSSGTASPATLDSEHNTFVTNKAGRPSAEGRGGALGTEGNTVLSDLQSTYHRNRALGYGAYGGAVYSDGEQSSRFEGSVFTGNSSGPATGGDGHGGAVFVNDQAGSAFVGVTMTGNRTASFGGGIDASEFANNVSVERSTIANNAAGNRGTYGDGGGIYAYDAALTVENSTIVHNRAYGARGHGGGIYSEGGVLGLRYSTVVDNVGRHGGGVYSYTAGGDVLGSIVTGNRLSPGGAEQDCAALDEAARLHSGGGNLVGQRTCVTAMQAGDTFSRHPRLGRLKDNGGPTMTRALSPKSAALGRGTFQCPTADQRGRHRPTTHCDAGAFELPRVKKHPHPHHSQHARQQTTGRIQP